MDNYKRIVEYIKKVWEYNDLEMSEVTITEIGDFELNHSMIDCDCHYLMKLGDFWINDGFYSELIRINDDRIILLWSNN